MHRNRLRVIYRSRPQSNSFGSNAKSLDRARLDFCHKTVALPEKKPTITPSFPVKSRANHELAG
jgi:hypothetical protein